MTEGKGTPPLLRQDRTSLAAAVQHRRIARDCNCNGKDICRWVLQALHSESSPRGWMEPDPIELTSLTQDHRESFAAHVRAIHVRKRSSVVASLTVASNAMSGTE